WDVDGLVECGGGRSAERREIAVTAKRLFDILMSLNALVVLSPLLLVVAVLVGVTSPGGVFFRQARVGRGGKPFLLIKFRTMRTEQKGPPVTVRGDQRVT